MSDLNELQGLLDALDPETRTYVAEVDLGQQAIEFVESDIGRFIIARCHEEIAEASRKLKGTLPWRFWRVQELQNQIWRAESLLLWLRDLIAAGKSANQALEEQEVHDD